MHIHTYIHIGGDATTQNELNFMDANLWSMLELTVGSHVRPDRADAQRATAVHYPGSLMCAHVHGHVFAQTDTIYTHARTCDGHVCKQTEYATTGTLAATASSFEWHDDADDDDDEDDMVEP